MAAPNGFKMFFFAENSCICYMVGFSSVPSVATDADAEPNEQLITGRFIVVPY